MGFNVDMEPDDNEVHGQYRRFHPFLLIILLLILTCYLVCSIMVHRNTVNMTTQDINIEYALN